MGGSGKLNGARLTPDINFEGRPFVCYSNNIIANQQILDGHDASITSLKKHLQFFREMVKSGKKDIIFNPDIKEQSIQKHFSTTKPIYFNPE